MPGRRDVAFVLVARCQHTGLCWLGRWWPSGWLRRTRGLSSAGEGVALAVSCPGVRSRIAGGSQGWRRRTKQKLWRFCGPKSLVPKQFREKLPREAEGTAGREGERRGAAHWAPESCVTPQVTEATQWRVPGSDVRAALKLNGLAEVGACAQPWPGTAACRGPSVLSRETEGTCGAGLQ